MTNFYNHFDDANDTPQYIERYHESHPDLVYATISPFVLPLYCRSIYQTVLIRDKPRQFIPYQPLLLLIPPNLIIHLPHMTLPPYNLPITFLLHLLMIFFVSDRDIPIS